jgi:pilus assembly protein Flp/PilA
MSPPRGAPAKEGGGLFISLFCKVQSSWLAFRGRITDERGAVATEYALLLILIALAIIAAATALGTAIAGKYTSACNSLGGAC